MPSDNPINDGVMQVLEAQAAEKRAQLDYQMAKAKSASVGRTVVPAVYAQLQQRHLKVEKQRQALREQGQAAPISPQALLPPTVDPTGMLPRGGGGVASSAAGDLLKQILGGGGIKRTGAPGAVANQAGALGTAMGMGGAAVGPAGAAMLNRPTAPGMQAPQPFNPSGPLTFESNAPAAAPVQPGTKTVQGPGAAISVSPTNIPGVGQVTQDLTGGQQAATILAGLLRRDPKDVYEGIVGKRDLGTTAIPTPYELGQRHAKSVGILTARMHDDDPAVRAQAAVEMEALQKYVTDSDGAEAWTAAKGMGRDLALQADEAKRQEELDPVLRGKREAALVTELGMLGGPDAVEKQYGKPARIWYEQHQEAQKRGTTVSLTMQPATAHDLEKGISEDDQAIAWLDQMEAAARAAPDSVFFKTGRGELEVMKFASGFTPGTARTLSAQSQREVQAYSNLRREQARMTTEEYKRLFGTAQTTGETNRGEGLLPKMEDGKLAFMENLAGTRETYALALMRKDYARRHGISGDVRDGYSLGDFRQGARDAIVNGIAEQIDLGKDPDTAKALVYSRMRRMYGLDAARLMEGQ